MTETGSGSAAVLDRGKFLRPIAHRGLHAIAKGVIENTAPAFEAAIAGGYGIECDLQPAADGTPFVFHDATLDRLVEATGRVAARAPAELSALRYRGSTERILGLAGFLALVAGRAPLLVEVKSSGAQDGRRFLEAIAAEAKAYAGPIALMSFDTSCIAALAELAPGVPRGRIVGVEQLPPNWQSLPQGAGREKAVSTLLDSFDAGVGFFAVDVQMLPEAAAVLARRSMRLPLFSWTIRTAAQRDIAARWADAPIFEGYEP